METLTERRRLAIKLINRIMRLTDEGYDELRVIDGFVRRLEKGLDTYGPLDLEKGEASRRDLDAEADEEIADWAVYRALKRTSQRAMPFDLSERDP